MQADPIRAPARAQDLTLRHRVVDYRSGDLERAYPQLALEEDMFINYGFLPRRHAALLHPRISRHPWAAATKRRAKNVLAFVRERGAVHPREVDAHFEHGTVTNYWGGSSNATTHLLDAMHYRGFLRVARRDAGVRVYAPRELTPPKESAASKSARADALLALTIDKYAPMTSTSLGQLASRLRYAAPQLDLAAALQRARATLASARVDGVEWWWPRIAGAEGVDDLAALEDVERSVAEERVRLLAPFDPVVWDRRRFELFWGWAYRFEAYTPVTRRKLGYYALPLLWRDDVIGWGNLAVSAGTLTHDIGYVAGHAPRERAFKGELAAELARMRAFLGL